MEWKKGLLHMDAFRLTLLEICIFLCPRVIGVCVQPPVYQPINKLGCTLVHFCTQTVHVPVYV